MVTPTPLNPPVIDYVELEGRTSAEFVAKIKLELSSFMVVGVSEIESAKRIRLFVACVAFVYIFTFYKGTKFTRTDEMNRDEIEIFAKMYGGTFK